MKTEQNTLNKETDNGTVTGITPVSAPLSVFSFVCNVNTPHHQRKEKSAKKATLIINKRQMYQA